MEKNLHKTSCLISIFLLIATGSFAASNVTLLESTESNLRFIVRVSPELATSIKNQTDPARFSQTVMLAVPPGTRIELAGVTSGNFIEAETIKKNRTTDFGDNQLVTISKTRKLRGREVASVEIFLETKTGYYESIEVWLRFSGVMAGGSYAVDPGFDRLLGSILLNFDVARHWPVERKIERNAQKVAVSPFQTVSQWYKIGVTKTGLTKINGSMLQAAGMNLASVNSDDIHLYNAGGYELPADNSVVRPDLREAAIQVIDGGDGTFDVTDEIIFYGEAVDRWNFTAADTFYNNGYTRENIYWLAVSSQLGTGLRMAERSGIPSGAGTPVLSFKRRVHLEQEILQRRLSDNNVRDHYTWYWSNDSDFTIWVPATGAVSGQMADITINARMLDIDLTVNGASAAPGGCFQTYCKFTTTALIDGLNEFNLTLRGISSILPHLDNIEVVYDSYFKPTLDRLDFQLGAISGVASVSIINSGAVSMLLDIDDPLRPVIVSFVLNSGLIEFEDTADPLSRNRYFLSSVLAASTPSSVVSATVTDLRGDLSQTDFIVITIDQFRPALSDYVAYRTAQGYSVRVVDITEIMDNFSWGLYDPIAIRDYLKFAYENFAAPRPLTALLVGDGTYDFLDRLGTGQPNYVPPFISTIDNGFTSSDDNYVYFGNYGRYDGDSSQSETDRGFDMVISRWPVKSVSEIATLTTKTKEYESSTNFGSWRTSMTLIADDEQGTFSTETIHVIQTETLEKARIPSYFTRDKIYLWDYPRVSNRRPEVNDAIVDRINDGTLVVNFVGHGNPDVWAHEHVFTRLNDVPRLNNSDRLPLFFAASCDIGFFDDPQREGMAEDLLAMAGGGAIGVISATRLVYSSQNHLFNMAVFDHLFSGELSIAEALFAAKLERSLNGNNSNDRKYILLGDPLLKLGVPRHSISFDTPPSSMTALLPVQVSGRVVDQFGSPVIADGTLLIDVLDSDRNKTFRLYNSNNTVIQTVAYTTTGPTIFRGTASIEAGNFDFSFIPPLDIGYGGQGARVSVYAKLGNSDGVGTIDSMMIADTIAQFADSTGPEIEYSFVAHPNFTSGDLISVDDQLVVTITDSSGINLAGGIGHGIFLEIDGKAENAVNLTQLFEYDQDDYTRGSLSYALPKLATGVHNFVIKAWDNANNPALTEFTASVGSAEKMEIAELLNYPNPMNISTTFSYRLNKMAEKFSLEIFTLSGRKIKSFERYAVSADYHADIKWYGDDADGKRVATGVYIYKALAVTENGGETVESFGKVVVIN